MSGAGGYLKMKPRPSFSAGKEYVLLLAVFHPVWDLFEKVGDRYEWHNKTDIVDLWQSL